MQTYRVTGSKIILGVGMVLKLHKSQASIRNHALKQKKKDVYIVLEPVQFKQGEIITIVSGNVSKVVLANLEDCSKEKSKTENASSSSKNNGAVKESKKQNDSKSKDDVAEDEDQDNDQTTSTNPVNDLPVS